MKLKYKLLILAVIILLIIVLIGSALVVKREYGLIPNEKDQIILNATEESKRIKDKEQKKPTEITLNDYYNYYNGTDAKIVLVSSPKEKSCIIEEPIIFSISQEYKLDIYYLNSDNFSAQDQNNFINSNEYLQKHYDVPLLMIVGNQQILGKTKGIKDKETYLAFFQKYKIIKEEK